MVGNYYLAVLLPVKIEGDSLTKGQIMRLTALFKTCQSQHKCTILFGIDIDKRNSRAVADMKLLAEKEGLSVETCRFEDQYKGRICYFWKTLATRAVHLGCDFYCLLGDDVEMHSATWIDDIVARFGRLQDVLGLPEDLFGFGCVALTDRQAPGFPTFPVLHRLHFELNGELFSDEFINQDADPFLFQLYRRFGAAVFCETAQLTNHVGGVQLQEDTNYVEPRYKRQHVQNWSGEILTSAMERVQEALTKKGCKECKYTTVDVVVPTFRVHQEFIERICHLTCSLPRTDVGFTIVVDNPEAKVGWLKALANSRRNLRVRVNDKNQGASHTRNVGLNESAAEFVLFLDDDVIPDPEIVDKYVAEARSGKGDAYDGFYGYCELPNMPAQIFPTAVHFSGVSFFWRAALTMPEVPWGITASLFVRRNACPRFDLRYLKTGGGEDIDFCLQLKRKRPLMSVKEAKILHPWWNNGNRDYGHFFNWAKSDGLLQDTYPQLTYHCCPDAVEFTLLAVTTATALLCSARVHASEPSHPTPLRMMLQVLSIPFSVLMADAAMDLYRYQVLEPGAEEYSRGITRTLAILESTLIKNVSCAGHVFGHWKRGKLVRNFCKRFDWFCGYTPEVVKGEKVKAAWRCAGFTATVAVTTQWVVPALAKRFNC